MFRVGCIHLLHFCYCYVEYSVLFMCVSYLQCVVMSGNMRMVGCLLILSQMRLLQATQMSLRLVVSGIDIGTIDTFTKSLAYLIKVLTLKYRQVIFYLCTPGHCSYHHCNVCWWEILRR